MAVVAMTAAARFVGGPLDGSELVQVGRSTVGRSIPAVRGGYDATVSLAASTARSTRGTACSTSTLRRGLPGGTRTGDSRDHLRPCGLRCSRQEP
jgi:hypothetical protein